MTMKTPYKVKCSACGAENLLNMELACVSSYERKMGPELEYMSVIEEECFNCGEDIAVQIEAWEYPEGTIETYSVRTEGAREIEQPVFLSEP